MNIIQNNPFRVLGVPVNAKEREIQKQITKATRYAEINKTISFDTDFPFLGVLNRTPEQIRLSSNGIEQPKKKIVYSLFWFWNENHIDDAAFENLKNNNIEKALEIWSKVVKDGAVSSKNYSNLANLKSLFLCIAFNNGSLNQDHFKNGVYFMGKFLNHEGIDDYCKTIAGDNISISKADLEDKYVTEIIGLVNPYLNKGGGITTSEFLNSFASFSNPLKNNLSQKFTSEPIRRVENEIENASEQRKRNSMFAVKFGRDLYNKTIEDLRFLLKTLGKSDIKFQMITNKVAAEILQCSIDYFNKEIENEDAFEEQIENALRVCKYADSIARDGQTKIRIRETVDTMNDWLASAPERRKVEKVKEDIDYISSKMGEALESLKYDGPTSTLSLISDAKDLITSTQTKLEHIKSVLGRSDQNYTKISSEVAQVTLALIIKYANSTSSVIGIGEDTIAAFRLIASLDMNSEMISRYNENKLILEPMHTRTKNARSSSSSGGGGCYIATMVYGDYDDAQVLVLRKFRDNVLTQYQLGRQFIKYYYIHSPALVEKWKDNHFLNRIIKNILNLLIKIINK